MAWYVGDQDPDKIPVEAFIDNLPIYLGRIDFAAPGPYGRDEYFIQWARRSFEATVDELHRWERNFGGAAGIFDDDFRYRTQRLHDFFRAARSFLQGVEHYIVRERPSGQVTALAGNITELDEDNVGRLVEQLRDFLNFYRDQCAQYDADVPNLGVILK
jgi:hypothetical protein